MATAVEHRLPIYHKNLLKTSSSLCISGARYPCLTRQCFNGVQGGAEVTAERQVVAERPNNVDYESLSARLASFFGWDGQNVSPSELANAGFYYTGIKDYVRCFFCGGGIKDWKRGDNPWNEHVKWYPHCEYTNQFHRGHVDGSRSDHTSLHPSQQDSVSGHAQQGHITDSNVATTVTRKATGLKSAECANPGITDLREENRKLKEQSLCKICLVEEACIVVLPCCHLVSCVPCSRELKTCAVCKANIKENIRVYQA